MYMQVIAVIERHSTFQAQSVEKESDTGDFS
jgi:hypothetical protein